MDISVRYNARIDDSIASSFYAFIRPRELVYWFPRKRTTYTRRRPRDRSTKTRGESRERTGPGHTDVRRACSSSTAGRTTAEGIDFVVIA